MVSLDGMGMGQRGMYPANRSGRLAAAGKILLLFLTQYAGRRNHRPA